MNLKNATLIAIVGICIHLVMTLIQSLQVVQFSSQTARSIFSTISWVSGDACVIIFLLILRSKQKGE